MEGCGDACVSTLFASRHNHLLLYYYVLLRNRNGLDVIAILIVYCLCGRRKNGGYNGWFRRSMRSLRCLRSTRLLERLVVVHLGILLVLILYNRCRAETLEGKIAHLLGQLVNRHLLGAPRQAELGAREPDATALDNRRDLRALDNQVLHGNTLERIALEVIELGVPLAVTLRQLHLDVRRVRENVALLILAVLEGRCVERLDDLAIQVGLEPRLRVLDALVNHELVHLLKNAHELLDLRALVVAAEGEVHRVLVLTLLVRKCIKAKGRGHRDSGLHHKALTVVVQVRLLGTALKRAESGKGNRLGLEIGREQDARHDGWVMTFIQDRELVKFYFRIQF